MLLLRGDHASRIGRTGSALTNAALSLLLCTLCAAASACSPAVDGSSDPCAELRCTEPLTGGHPIRPREESSDPLEPSSAVDGEDAGSDGAAPPPVQPSLPTGLTPGYRNVFWNTAPSDPAGHNQVSLDIRPDTSGPDDASLQYFAFGGANFQHGPAGSGFYGGLQSKITNNTSNSGKRGVIFSARGALTAIPAPGAALAIDRADGVGAGYVQLSLAYVWTNHTTYRMLYKFMGDAPLTYGYGHQLLRASVTNMTTNQESILGDIVLSRAWGTFPSQGYFSLDETFPPSGAPETCRNYNASDVTYSRLRLGTAAGAVVTVWNQGDSVYAGPCVRLFHYDPIADGYRIRLGVYAP